MFHMRGLTHLCNVLTSHHTNLYAFALSLCWTLLPAKFITMPMTKRFLSPLLFASLFSILPIATHAQPLPKIHLQPIFKSRTFDRPIWMCQAPGDADHFYVIEEPGRIL